LFVAIPVVATGAELLVGVVRDTDGYAVAGAQVTLVRADGSTLGTTSTASDGTFAADLAELPARVAVGCRYCLGASAAVGASGSVAVVVRRFGALQNHGIAPEDARALPYAYASELASLIPFTVTGSGAVSDRGLAQGHGSVVDDGIPFYRATDGLDLGWALPAGATAAIDPAPPSVANEYDDRAAGGLYAIDTLDPAADAARLDAGGPIADVGLRGGADLRGAFAAQSGPTYGATRGVVDALLGAGGGTLDLRAIAMSAGQTHASGALASFALPLPKGSLSASLSASTSEDPYLSFASDAIAALGFERGGFAFGLRGSRDAGALEDGPGTQYDVRAFAQYEHDDGRTRVLASLAAARAGAGVPSATDTANALLPILSLAQHIGATLVLSADSVDTLLPQPLYAEPEAYGAAIDRTHLIDGAFGFDDGRRFQLELVAFRELLTGSVPATTGGSGISAVWQIAPALAVRAWSLISRTNGSSSYDAYGPVEYTYNPAADNDRSLIWITAGTTLRVDALLRNGALEGDVNAPLGEHVWLTIGTERVNGVRRASFGLSWR
jgi:hypothetical protein